MMSRKQVMDELRVSSDDAALFLNEANRLNLLHLAPMDALRLMVKDMVADIGAHLYAGQKYQPQVPRQQLD